MTKHILLIEDEEGLRMTLQDRLEAEKYAVETAGTGTEGLELAKSGRFDLIILDIMLPGIDGFSVCRQLRQAGIQSPVLMLTAKSLLQDKVTGLKLGADDYLTKPFEMEELIARAGAQLRRGEASKQAVETTVKENASLIIDLKRGYISNHGTEYPLLAQEIKLLDYLYRHQGEIISRESLLNSVWGYEGDISTRTVDVHIARIRQKLGDIGDVPKYIQTVRGIGYKFFAP